jgi:hypothetical protein
VTSPPSAATTRPWIVAATFVWSCWETMDLSSAAKVSSPVGRRANGPTLSISRARTGSALLSRRTAAAA